MLTPESIAAMTAASAAWMGSQGIPVVGQAVDAGLLVLGVVLLAAQTAELTDALWAYVNLSARASTQAELDEAAAHLSRAIAIGGVNVIAFILTKKMAGAVKPEHLHQGLPSPLLEKRRLSQRPLTSRLLRRRPFPRLPPWGPGPGSIKRFLAVE